MRLARALNMLEQYLPALEVLTGIDAPEAELHMQRGQAFYALGRTDDAEQAFRSALQCDLAHRRACMRLCKILRASGRHDELLAQCEALAGQGVTHAQLLLDWGRAFALTGQWDKAHALLFDADKVERDILPVPLGFADMESFNEALAEELLTNPYHLTQFPEAEEANRGSARVHHLLCGKRPELIRALLAVIQAAVDARIARMDVQIGANAWDIWSAARPAVAHLRPWGLIQRNEAYEDWHTHRGGWLSGVYYIRVPKDLSEGRGSLEFGPPPSIADRGVIASRRYAPIPGALLTAPSHYHHRTIPTGRDEYRISFAFDVVSDDKPTVS